MKKIVGLNGSLSTPSKTNLIVRSILDRVSEATGADAEMVAVSSLVSSLGISSRGEASAPLEQALSVIENADLVIAGSPVYKGSYTGLFKHIIDLVDYNALQGVPVALIATGGSSRHALVIEHQLRPLFGSFCAYTLPTGVFVADGDMSDGLVQSEVVRLRIDRLVDEAVSALNHRQSR